MKHAFGLTLVALAATLYGSGAECQEGMRGAMMGFHYGFPLKWSAVLAMPLRKDRRTDSRIFMYGEPGIGGWRAGAGYFRITDNLGSGYVLRASALRTGGRPWRADRYTTYAGGELQYMALYVIGVRVGGYARVSQGTGKRGLLAVDLSLLL
ncbi:MAG: hypothetical protein ACRENU_09295 [Gemmatimonadaceae bacterium]